MLNVTLYQMELLSLARHLGSDDWAEWTCQEGVEFLHALQQVRKVKGMYSRPWTRRSSYVLLHHPRSSAALLYPTCSKLSRPSVAYCMKSRHPFTSSLTMVYQKK